MTILQYIKVTIGTYAKRLRGQKHSNYKSKMLKLNLSDILFSFLQFCYWLYLALHNKIRLIGQYHINLIINTYCKSKLMTEGKSGNGNNAGAGNAGPGANTGGAGTGVPPPSQGAGATPDAAGGSQGNGPSADAKDPNANDRQTGNGELKDGTAAAVVEADAAQTADNSVKPQEAKGGGGFAIFYQERMAITRYGKLVCGSF